MFPLRRHLLIIILQKPVCPTLYNPNRVWPSTKSMGSHQNTRSMEQTGTSQEATDRMKRHPTKWEKVLANHVSERG